MFTGIVVDRGRIRKARGRGHLEMEIASSKLARVLKRGDSVSVNGVCLTAVRVGRRDFTVRAVAETLARSTLGDVDRGSVVNLEPAARVGDRLGGHIVQGHVDGVAVVARTEDDGPSRRLWIELDEDLLRYLVPKGSVTLDGVSLTVVEVGKRTFQVAVIQHTLEETTLGAARQGTRLNVEVDVIAKYVERLGAAHASESSDVATGEKVK